MGNQQRTSEERTKWVLVDIAKIDDYLEGNTMTDSKLSVSIRRSRGWFCSVRRRAKDGVAAIARNDALAISRALQCSAQDIAVLDKNTSSGKTKYSIEEPLVIRYEEKARAIFDELVCSEAETISETLDIYRKLDDEEKHILSSALDAISKKNYPMGSRYSGDWWKYIVFLELADRVLVKSEVSDFETLKRRFLDTLDKHKKQSGVGVSVDDQVIILKRILSNEWDKLVRALMEGPGFEESLAITAHILLRYIRSGYGKDRKKIHFLEEDRWRIGVLFNWLSD